MTRASAIWPSRSPSSRWAAGALALLLGCGNDAELRGTPVAKVGDEVLYREVVEMIAAREGIDEAAAEARALETLRWVAARREELAAQPEGPQHPDDLDPARAARLERGAMVRLWLREHFESEHQTKDMPDSVVDKAMADPALTRRLFHPEVWLICQALIVPASADPSAPAELPPGEGEPARIWRERAELAIAGFARRARRFESELVGDPRCEAMVGLLKTSVQDFPADPTLSGPEGGPLRLRYESFGFAPSNHALDAGWVESVVAGKGPGLVGPFATRFGVHLVLVSKIEGENLAEGSLPEDDLQRAREEYLREHLLDQWRSAELEREVGRARDARVVRLNPALGEP